MNRKVLLVRSNPYDFDPNSYNVQEIGIGKALCHLGYDFDYITFKKNNQSEWIFYEENGCKARWIEKPRIRFLRMGFNTEIWKKDFLAQYDIVICREYYQYMTYKISQNHNNVTIYNGPYWNMFMFPPASKVYDLLFAKKINKSVNCILTKSELSSNYLRNKGYDNLYTVGVALDTTRFNNVEMEESTRELVSYMTNNRCILYVGTVDSNKNYPFMLKVYEELLKKYADLKFVVIGKSKQSAVNKLLGKKDDSFEKACYNSVPKHVIDGIYRVQRVENPQLKYIYPHAKAFLLPSKKEIFGMVLLEAMYLGAPVVTSLNGGSLTLISGKMTGKIVDIFDEHLWADAISEYIENEVFRNEIANNAKKLINEEYNWNALVIKMLKYMGEQLSF